MSEIKVDTVAEKTSANGVTIDGLNIKDSKLVTANSIVEANITDGAISAAKLASGVGGIAMADQWRTNANRSSFSTGVINQHWERVDSDSYGSIGSAMTQSSGVFTFPATGRYLVMGHIEIIVGDNRDYSGGGIEVTTNNSSYNYASSTFQWGQDGKYISVNMNHLLNVSDTSNIKVRLFFENESGNDVIIGSTNETRTSMTFIRLGDS